jgi:hypothetical protein
MRRPMQMFVQLNARGLPAEGARALGACCNSSTAPALTPECETDCEAGRREPVARSFA